MAHLTRFAENRRGGAAVEMAIVAPVIAGLALVSAEVWMMAMDKQRAATALDAAVDYYMGGGLSDAEASAVALDAWEDPPGAAEVAYARSGRCAADVVTLNIVCPNGDVAATYVTLTASGEAQGLFDERSVEATRMVRVR